VITIKMMIIDKNVTTSISTHLPSSDGIENAFR